MQQAYVNDVSPRKRVVLAQELGVTNLAKRTVSRMGKSLDEHVLTIRIRRFDAAVPYVLLDART